MPGKKSATRHHALFYAHDVREIFASISVRTNLQLLEYSVKYVRYILVLFIEILPLVLYDSLQRAEAGRETGVVCHSAIEKHAKVVNLTGGQGLVLRLQ